MESEGINQRYGLENDVNFICASNDDSSNQTTNVKANKMTLIEKSEYFRALFSNWKEANSNEIPKLDIKANILSTVFSFMYTSQISFKDVNESIDILSVADEFLLADLSEIVQKFIATNLTEENVFHLIDYAVHRSVTCPILMRACDEFVLEHTNELFSNKERITEHFSIEVWKHVVSISQLYISEFELFKVILEWAKAQQENLLLTSSPTINGFDGNTILKRLLSPILSDIRFGTFSAIQLTDFVEPLSLIDVNFLCQLYKKLANPAAQIQPQFQKQFQPRGNRATIKRFLNRNGTWSYSVGKPDEIVISMNRNATLLSVSLLATMKTKIRSLRVQRGKFKYEMLNPVCTFTSTQLYSKHGLQKIELNPPLRLEKETQYLVSVELEGPSTLHGSEGKIFDTGSDGFVVSFFNPAEGNGTCVSTGQIPELEFLNSRFKVKIKLVMVIQRKRRFLELEKNEKKDFAFSNIYRQFSLQAC